MSRLAAAMGLARSVAIYACRPDRTRAQARFYAGLLPPGALAFDIGAHMGNRTRALRRAGARVVALEPQHACWRVLRATLPGDVTLIRAAAGAEAGHGVLHVAPRHPTVSTLSTGFVEDTRSVPGFGQVRWSRTEETPVTTLDALIAAHGRPDYVKIDVEGFEAEVLAGLSGPVPLVSIEVIPGLVPRSESALDRLCALGFYRFNVARGEDGAFLFPDWIGRDRLVGWLSALPPGDKPCDVYARHDPAATLSST